MALLGYMLAGAAAGAGKSLSDQGMAAIKARAEKNKADFQHKYRMQEIDHAGNRADARQEKSADRADTRQGSADKKARSRLTAELASKELIAGVKSDKENAKLLIKIKGDAEKIRHEVAKEVLKIQRNPDDLTTDTIQEQITAVQKEGKIRVANLIGAYRTDQPIVAPPPPAGVVPPPNGNERSLPEQPPLNPPQTQPVAVAQVPVTTGIGNQDQGWRSTIADPNGLLYRAGSSINGSRSMAGTPKANSRPSDHPIDYMLDKLTQHAR